MGRPVDLVRVKKARNALRGALEDHPEVRERTARFLASDPTAEQLEALMSERRDMPVRIPLVLLERADALIDPMEEHLELLAYSRPNRAAVIRLALGIGLEQLERRVGREGGTDGAE